MKCDMYYFAGGYGAAIFVPCRVIQKRGGIKGFIFGNRLIKTEGGELYWVSAHKLLKKV